MDYQSLVSFNGWTFVAQICNLFIQIYLFQRFLFKPVKKIVEQRQAQVDQLMSEAQTAKDTALAEKADYEAHLKDVRLEAEDITSKAIASAKQQSEEIIKAAKSDADAIREKAARDIEQDRRKAMSDAKNEISSMAVEIASKLVNKEINEETHEALIDEFIKEFGDE